jgi:HlyD family secretion protein
VLLERTKDSNSETGRAIAAESKLFDLRRQARSGQKAQLKERSAQSQEEIKDYFGQAESKLKEVDLIHQKLEGVRTLWQKNLVPMTRLTSLERDAARLEGERSQLGGMIAQTKGKIAEIELQIIQIDQDLRTEVGKGLIETRSKLSELAERKIDRGGGSAQSHRHPGSPYRVHARAIATIFANSVSQGIRESWRSVYPIVPIKSSSFSPLPRG